MEFPNDKKFLLQIIKQIFDIINIIVNYLLMVYNTNVTNNNRKQVSMIRKCHNNRPKANAWHHEEGTEQNQQHNSKNTIKVRKTARIRNQYNQVPHLSQDTKWESNKITINITNKSQEVSPFPSGDHKAAMNRGESITNKGHK